ncbi:1910_t:CDS:2 [Ambispora gerdemannii]|uniref:Transcription initiation factor TFIID subunit 8 n=1 Tax=Ambispora gerdemannii TaxID=144530 RepID=A0A9N8YSK9_9GLOM|nr:1910_t:CDS:2 [Ambispora gerdemannii]
MVVQQSTDNYSINNGNLQQEPNLEINSTVAEQVSKKVGAFIVKDLGYDSISGQALDALVFETIASSTHKYAELGRRHTPNLYDVEETLNGLGIKTEALEEYMVSHNAKCTETCARNHDRQQECKGAKYKAFSLKLRSAFIPAPSTLIPELPNLVKDDDDDEIKQQEQYTKSTVKEAKSKKTPLGKHIPKYIPSHLPAFPPKHSYKSTPKVAKIIEDDQITRRERNIQQVRMMENNLRKLTTMENRMFYYPTMVIADAINENNLLRLNYSIPIINFNAYEYQDSLEQDDKKVKSRTAGTMNLQLYESATQKQGVKIKHQRREEKYDEEGFVTFSSKDKGKQKAEIQSPQYLEEEFYEELDDMEFEEV